jgi:hypothetical protein
MKNLFKGFVVAAMAILAIACGNEMPEPVGNGIQAPEFSANANENSITVSWIAVDGAAYYELWLNNESEHVKTDKLVHRFDGLKWNTEYTVNIQAISTDASKNSKVASQKVTIAERKVPAYREWYPQNGSAAAAISDNGRWVVGCFDRQGMIIDLDTDEITYIENFDCMDVADDGIIVGTTYEDSQSGEAALYINGKSVKLDLSELTKSDMSSFQAVTPDGLFAVGWWWEYDENSYYGKMYDTIVPFAYDVLKDRIIILEAGDTLYGVGAVSPYGVSPDHKIVGCEQGYAMMAVLWEDEYSKFTYPAFEYDSEYRPTLSFGDTMVRMTPNGKYIYSVAKTYPEGGGEVAQPGCYNLETKELTRFEGTCSNGTVTAMTDDGIAFLNDASFYMGTTSYVVDLNSNNTTYQEPIADWLAGEHNIDIYDYLQEGIITIGTSADGRTILGIVNTDAGWMTYVIDLDGEPMPAIAK